MNVAAKSPKVPVIEIVLVLVAVGLVSFILWYVNQAKQNTDQVLDQANKSSTQAVLPTQTDLKVVAAKLPAGWQVERAYESYVRLTNTANKCFSQIDYATDTAPANAPSLNHQLETVKAIETEGYTVRNVGVNQQNLQTAAGVAPVTAKSYRLTLDGVSKYQSYGFIETDNQLISTQTSCPRQSDLTAASNALTAVTVNHRLEF